MYCPNCGTLCGEDHKFCHQCGIALQPAESEPVCDVLPTSEPDSALPPVVQETRPEDLPEPPVEEEDLFIPEADAPVKKGRLWPPIVIMAVIFAVGTLIFFLLPGTASGGQNHAPQNSEIPWFRVENGTLYFDEEKYTGGAVLTVPRAIGGQTITSISAGCFQNCDTLVSVVLPDTVTHIMSRAFYDCDALRGIELPESVQRVDTEAFSGCGALESILIPENIGQIASGAFDDCGMLYYIFFMGSSERWQVLYSDYITPYTYVSTTDGVFRHIGNS